MLIKSKVLNTPITLLFMICTKRAIETACVSAKVTNRVSIFLADCAYRNSKKTNDKPIASNTNEPN